ncbi:hypothetical protein [Massilia soli]|nr:hypothetical protein [Massilia soli]
MTRLPPACSAMLLAGSAVAAGPQGAAAPTLDAALRPTSTPRT